MTEISVIIPVYNAAEYLRECMDSVLGQNFQDCEMICIDGGSTDGSLEILEGCRKKDSRVKIIRQSNDGLAYARNVGIEHAAGTYICFLDSDDFMNCGSLQCIFQEMKQEKLDMLCFDTALCYDNNEIAEAEIAEKEKYFKRDRDASDVQAGKWLWMDMAGKGDYCVPVWLMAVRKKFLTDQGIAFENGCIAEDNLYTLQCYLKAVRAKYIPQKLYTYRLRKGSLREKKATCLGLYSLVRVYAGMLKLAKESGDDAVAGRIFALARQMAREVRSINRRIPDEEKRSFQIRDAETDILFYGMAIGKYGLEEYDSGLYIEGFRNKLRHVSSIVLYGAGRIGSLWMDYLKQEGWNEKIRSFMVSEAAGRKERIHGVAVCSLDEFQELPGKEEILVILSVAPESQEALINNCRLRNIKNVMRTDQTMLQYIRSKKGE